MLILHTHLRAYSRVGVVMLACACSPTNTTTGASSTSGSTGTDTDTDTGEQNPDAAAVVHSFGRYQLGPHEEIQPCLQWTLHNENP